MKAALAGITALVVVAWAVPARAQFDPAHNHLFCYGIHEIPPQVFTPVSVDITTQLGTEVAVPIMRPSLLCAPAIKTGATGEDPLPPTPVRHFTCYRPKRGERRGFTVQVEDQFGTGFYTITSRRLLCAPSSKQLGSPSGAFLE